MSGRAFGAPEARWSEPDRQALARALGPEVPAPLADRIYSSRLYGADPVLALEGGGNTSVKIGGCPGGLEVLWVKGSGRDLADLGPADFAPLDRDLLARLARDPRDPRDGRGIGNEIAPLLAAARLDPAAPSPSVEAPLHALIDAPFVDHTHAEAVLVLGNAVDGAARLREALGEAFAVIEYAAPGLPLASAVAGAAAGRTGVVVRGHGIFTWGATAREAFEAMRDAVERCAAALGPPRAVAGGPRLDQRFAARLAPRLRGALARADGDGPGGLILVHRDDGPVATLLTGDDLDERAARALLTPDQATRTHLSPLVLRVDADDPDDRLDAALAGALERFADRVRAVAAATGHEGRLAAGDLLPRVVLVPGAGLFAAGPTRRRALGAARLAEHALGAVAAGDAAGRYEPPDEAHVAGLYFWDLQRAKLARDPHRPLAGRTALVTGAAGAIGAGVAAALRAAGATVLLADRPGERDAPRLARALDRARGAGDADDVLALPFDVTDPADVARALADAARLTGGVDLLVLSQGIAEVAGIDALDPARLEQVFRVNALGSFHVLGAFVRQVRATGRGGDVVLVSTKNVPEPGASFSAYSASKAAAHQLARVAAIELAPDDIRVNMVSPDAVFGDDEIPSALWREVGAERARSRGIDPAELPERYRQRNLLKARVTVADVARAVLFFARRATPTTGAVLPVDGGLPGAFPR